MFDPRLPPAQRTPTQFKPHEPPPDIRATFIAPPSTFTTTTFTTAGPLATNHSMPPVQPTTAPSSRRMSGSVGASNVKGVSPSSAKFVDAFAAILPSEPMHAPPRRHGTNPCESQAVGVSPSVSQVVVSALPSSYWCRALESKSTVSAGVQGVIQQLVLPAPPQLSPVMETYLRTQPELAKFFSRQLPPISIADYVARLVAHLHCSMSVFPVAMTYLMRVSRVCWVPTEQFPTAAVSQNALIAFDPLIKATMKSTVTESRVRRAAAQPRGLSGSYANGAAPPVCLLHPLATHRLILAACVLATKYLDDHFYSTQFYSEVGGIAPLELAALEWSLLSLLDFDAYVDEATVAAIVAAMQQHHAEDSARRPS